MKTGIWIFTVEFYDDCLRDFFSFLVLASKKTGLIRIVHFDLVYAKLCRACENSKGKGAVFSIEYVRARVWCSTRNS